MVVSPKEEIAEFVRLGIGLEDGWESYSTIGIEKDGSLIAGVVYSGFVRNKDRYQCCDMHVYAIPKSGWMTRTTLKHFFGFPFKQLGCERVNGLVPSSNKHALDIDERLGFEYESTAVRMLPGEDLIVLRMFKENCRWINGR